MLYSIRFFAFSLVLSILSLTTYVVDDGLTPKARFTKNITPRTHAASLLESIASSAISPHSISTILNSKIQTITNFFSKPIPPSVYKSTFRSQSHREEC